MRPRGSSAAASVIIALVLFVTGFGVAVADEVGPPVFSSLALTDPVGATRPDQAELYCPPNRVVTSLDNYFSAGATLSEINGYCSPVGVDAGSARVDRLRERIGASIAGQGSQRSYAGDTECGDGQAAVGIAGTAGTGGEVRSLQLLCRTLRADGTLAPGAAYAAPEAGVRGPVAYGPNYCPDRAVATRIFGYAEYYGQIYNVRLRCQVLGFPSTAPVDVNLTWATALTVGENSTTSGAITAAGQDRWYRFPVQPGARVQVDLSGLPIDADLALFTDIGQSFTSLTSTTDLNRLSAEFAGDAFAPSVFSPSVFSPSVFSPSVFSPSVFSPSVFSPSVFSPSVFSPSVFSPSVFSPSVFSPSVFSPSVFSPAVSLPSVFSPSVFSPSVFSPSVFSDAFSSAQTRSLIGVSARDGTAAESVSSATWNNTGYFYVRVQGRNGSFSPTSYSLKVTTTAGVCATGLDAHTGHATITGTPGSARTVILTDSGRLPGSNADKDALAAKLSEFAAEVDGVVVDLRLSDKVAALNGQADRAAFRSCPYAKNLVAQAARDIVNSYRDSAATVQYVVIVGGDAVVPFFRYPDAAGLGPESGYAPPVAEGTASDASLRGNYVLGQDAYGSAVDVDLKGSTIPVPDLAVGRLVESPSQITATLNRYNGAPIRPASTLSTGYDFLTDAADAVAADFAAGNATGRNDTLITDADVPPTTTTQGGTPSRRTSWTAGDLRSALLGRRHDLVYLAGHFSANNTLAADYDTTLRSTEVANATAGNFANTLVFSAGCHSGYTIVDGDGVAGVTDGLDWTEAFARQGATLVGGTGYQYGDTDFLEYSERLYANLVRELRYGTGAVPVGRALAAAKQTYLRTTASLGGIDQKAVLEATLYGLPMQGVDLPTGRLTRPTDDTIATPEPAPSGTPGAVLGLQTDDVTLSPTTTPVTRTLTNLDGGSVTATYLRGPDGVSAGPGEPALPLSSSNVSAPSTGTTPGGALRGVALLSADYTDTNGITPLTGAPVTETHGVHGPFVTPSFFPNRLASINYFDAVGGAPAGGTTRLMLTPAQYRSDGPASLTTTQRRYSSLGLRLFYSSYRATPNGNAPALAAPPGLTDVRTTVQGSTVAFSARVVGNPAAGIQQVWVTYTGEAGSPLSGSWRSIALAQNSTDSTLWTGSLTLPSGQSAAAVRYLAQAVNGVGVVGVDDNQGSYFTPGVQAGLPSGSLAATRLTLASPVPTSGAYGDTLTVKATLTRQSGGALANQAVTFAIGASTRTAFTNSSGLATAALPLSVLPGSYQLVAAYDGDATTAGTSTTPTPFSVVKQPTQLSLAVTGGTAVATLTGRGNLPLREKSVLFGYVDAGGSVLGGQVVATDRSGVADLDLAGRPSGTVRVAATFGSATSAVPGGTADLSDPSYAASQARADLVAAQPDSYTMTEGSTLSVAKPGVLANDSAGTTASLVSGPTVGTLALQGDGSFRFTPPEDYVGPVTFSYRATSSAYGSATATVSITVNEATPSGCTILGTRGNDTLNGTSSRDVICGLGGNDVINGGGGDDLIFAGSGDDTVDGGEGNDTIAGRWGADTINGGAGDDKLLGGSGNDTIRGDAGADQLWGLDGNDTLTGDLGQDTINAGPGNDALDLRDGAGGDNGDGGDGTDTAAKDSGDTVTKVP